MYFDVIGDLCFCNDIEGLFSAIGLEHRPNEWRLFIHSSVRSLKAVLLHNGNKYPFLPLAYSSHMKEDYENVQKLLYYIKYEKREWDVCGDFKMIGCLLGLQSGCTKYSCFLSLEEQS